jgi:GH15 family glucan-1,4-alpha-glucosidase
MPYQPIEDYGIIGNLRTAALIGKNASIDWFCFPRFDSPSVFGAILDDKKGGCFRIAPVDAGITPKQLYWPDTNILVSRFLSADGVGEVVDFMPIHATDTPESGRLIRRVRVLRGTMRFRLECYSAFNYATEPHTTRLVNGGAHFNSPSLRLGLKAGIKLQHSGNGVSAEFSLSEGKGRSVELYELDAWQAGSGKLSEPESEQLFVETTTFWRDWISKSAYRGRWREIVNRSALILEIVNVPAYGGNRSGADV